jgi:hypothetical protein
MEQAPTMTLLYDVLFYAPGTHPDPVGAKGVAKTRGQAFSETLCALEARIQMCVSVRMNEADRNYSEQRPTVTGAYYTSPSKREAELQGRASLRTVPLSRRW